MFNIIKSFEDQGITRNHHLEQSKIKSTKRFTAENNSAKNMMIEELRQLIIFSKFDDSTIPMVHRK